MAYVYRISSVKKRLHATFSSLVVDKFLSLRNLIFASVGLSALYMRRCALGCLRQYTRNVLGAGDDDAGRILFESLRGKARNARDTTGIESYALGG